MQSFRAAHPTFHDATFLLLLLPPFSLLAPLQRCTGNGRKDLKGGELM